MNQPKWTQDEAIAFECARECITDVMAICSAAIADEERRGVPDTARLVELEAQLARLSSERAGLKVTDHDRVATVRREYGAQVLAHRAQQQRQAA